MRKRRHQGNADEAARRLARAGRDLEQAQLARQDEQAKTRDAARVNRALGEIEERNDISGLIREIFGFGENH